MQTPDIANRFTYHAPATPARADQHTQVRQACESFAHFLNSALPEGREKSHAVTKLEEVMFWANAGIARTP